MARLLKNSLIVLTLSTFVSVVPAKAADLQSMYVKAWLEIQTGFNERDQKDYRKALADFQAANTILNQIHRIDPTWEAAIVAARTRDCQKMLAELPDLVPDTVPSSGDGGVVTSPPPQVPVDNASSRQNDMRAAALKAELDRTKLQLQNAQAGLQQYRKEHDLQAGKIAALTQELDAIKSEHPGDDAASQQLAAENKDLKERQQVLEQQIKTLTEGGTSEAVKRLQDQLNTVQAQLTASEHTNSDLVATNNALKQQLENAIQKINTDLSNKANDEQLVKENLMLRDMLRHELQEQDRKEAARRLAIEEFSNLKIQSRVLKKQIEIITSPITFLTPEERDFAKTVIVPAMPLQGNQKPDFSLAQNNPVASPSPSPEPAATTTPTTPSPAPVAATTPVPDNTTSTAASPTPAPSLAATESPSPAPAASTTPAPSESPAPSVAMNTTPEPTSSTPVPSPDLTASGNTTPAPATTQSPTTDTNSTAPITPVVQNYQPPQDPTPTPPPADSTLTVTHPETTSEHTVVHNYTPAETPTPNDPTTIATNAVVPNDMQSLAEEGASLFKMKRYDEAAARYESIIAKYPESLYAWSNLGVVRFQQGDYMESKKALMQAIKLNPNDALCRRNLGIVYYQMESYEAAIDELTQSIAMDSTDPLSHFYLGCACYQKGWLETCVKQVNKSLDLDDEQPDVHLYLSMVYAKEKSQLDEGRKHYKRALDLGEARNENLEKLLQM